ncbi:MAG TPA: serine/threonine-protein kinase [Kofleriaceae bacterium]|nr:serine/threonine-protein kinase [Kofleriaceae bacterium]
MALDVAFAGKTGHLDDSVPHRDTSGVGAGGVGPVRLVGLLGEGGMAQVYLGHHDGLGRHVAVKRLHRHLANVDEARDRLRAEAEIARSLDHENIVHVLDVLTDRAGEVYLVMEHLGGEPLSARLARAGALPMSESLTIGVQIADALAAVHRRGIVHRDLKTENVLVGLDASGSVLAKLIDFGVAEVVGTDGAIAPETVTGTPESMSPEQATASPLDHRSDIYSFGVLLYEMVTGGPPFLGGELEALLDRVVREAPVPPSRTAGGRWQLIPEELEQLILHCLGKRPDERPRDMDEVRARLTRIAADYRALSDALDRAVAGGAEMADAIGLAEREVGQALVVVQDVVDVPLPPPSPVRAVGTSDEHCRAGDGAARRQPAVRARAREHTLPAKRAAMRPAARPARRPHRWARGASAAVLVAGLAFGVTGLAGHMLRLPGFENLSGPFEELEVPWAR